MSMSVSSISSASASSSSVKLSDVTKKKLEALGVDTTNIKTETQGQNKLKEAQAMSNQQNQQAQGNGVSTQQEMVKFEATMLAQKMGIEVSKNDSVSDILSHIQVKLAELKTSAGKDTSMQSEIGQYQSSYDNIKQSSQSLSLSMNSMASYNKIFHNL